MTDAVLAILAGGRGLRMGTPKGLLRLQQRPILQYILERLGWPGPVWLITAPGSEHPPGWEKCDRELTDPVADLGPLRGVLTALEQLDGPELLVTTIDMPRVSADALRWMLEQLRGRPEIAGLMCATTGDKGTRIEPFPLTLRRTAEPIIRSRLTSGRASVRKLLEDPAFVSVNPPAEFPADLWLNLNLPEDLQMFG